MKMTRQEREIHQVELVETYNIANSLRRINDQPNWNHKKWKRALYHALSMSEVCDGPKLTAIRTAMELE